MCGISGIYSYQADKDIDIELLKEMTDLIYHRGPDDEGYLFAEPKSGRIFSFDGSLALREYWQKSLAEAGKARMRLGFGFRRLPTVDLQTSGHQPMYDADLGLAIIFNGEIYNHIELRAELKELGYSFFSKSDTEVILKSYHAWGDEAQKKLNGMWSFAIWDCKRRRLLLSRDRFGIKPFYYAEVDGTLYWGSEIKQLVKTPVAKDLNKAMVWRSMKINGILAYGEQTYFKNIKALMPGHYLVVEDDAIRELIYYQQDIESFEKNEISFADAVERYRELFWDSMRLNLRCDVEVGASLSGGMDSSAIVCAANQILDYPLQTFSTYYAEDAALDERSWIASIAAATGVKNELIAPNAKNALEWWDHATYLNDLPVASGFISQYAVMKTARERGITVLLSGHGSDEISAGYRHATYRYYADLLRGLRFKNFGREIGAFMDQGLLGNIASLGKILLSSSLKESKLYHLELKNYRFEPFNKDFTTAATREERDGILGQISDIQSSRLSNFLYNMMRSTSIQSQLHYEDRMSMGNSVEGRVPFLDYRLVDFVFSLPSHYKIQPPYRKVIHRKAMKPCVPPVIAQRRDKGIFGSPFISHWMKGELKDFMQSVLHSPQFRSRGFWDLPKIHKRWQGYLKGNLRDGEVLYGVVALEIWARQFS